jgi:aryl-alcohol dehydrogenase-like predicted oxidoreductase
MGEAINRRGFLQGSAAATASAMAVAAGQTAPAAPDDKTKDKAKPKAPELPRRPLGKTGVALTILELGTWQSTGTERLLRLAYDRGVRTFDTADCYGTESAFAKWFRKQPEVRKEIFLVTKDHPKSGPGELLQQIDQRLHNLGTDYVDLFLIHGIGIDYGYNSLEWPKSREFQDVCEKLKKSGKARFVGFSCHDARRAEYLQAAAEGGFVDAIMLQYTPWLAKDDPLNRALDACHEKGIGLLSMKQITGQSLDQLRRMKLPALKGKKLTPAQGLLRAIWTDERITAANVSMRNEKQLRENVAAAVNFEPLAQAELDELRAACLAAGPTFCGDCDGRCARAAGTQAALGDLTRLLTYHQQYGARREARRLYAALPEEMRDWSGADLEAARAACPHRLDFAALLPQVERYLA